MNKHKLLLVCYPTHLAIGYADISSCNVSLSKMLCDKSILVTLNSLNVIRKFYELHLLSIIVSFNVWMGGMMPNNLFSNQKPAKIGSFPQTLVIRLVSCITIRPVNISMYCFPKVGKFHPILKVDDIGNVESNVDTVVQIHGK